ncbi:MAG TPA: uroporphyrinogen decarboxylase family protein [Candidatus Sulfotelmatobacter sp.]|nr:uroporphyrinogen decarboxylase family protein [Candidatus Sulfotelmatobacter sp.]
MTKRERIEAAVHGRPVDRVPISFWRHFPEAEMDAESLAEALAAFQRRYDLDFVKMMPNATYATEDWGCETAYTGDPMGARKVLKGVVHESDDWRRIRPVDPRDGAFGREVRCVGLLRKAVGEGTPIVQTVFNPLSVAYKLGGERVLEDIRRPPAALHTALQAIAETLRGFVKACLQAGADGIFFATQLASEKFCSAGKYREFGRPYDLQVLEAAEGSGFSVLHLHGADIFFDLVADYPVHAVNWHDRRVPPSLAEARERYSRCFVGGMNETETLPRGPASRVREEVLDAIAQVQGRGVIVGPGCVFPVGTPEAHLEAARRAVEGG